MTARLHGAAVRTVSISGATYVVTNSCRATIGDGFIATAVRHRMGMETSQSARSAMATMSVSDGTRHARSRTSGSGGSGCGTICWQLKIPFELVK